ncbi:MAG: ribosomal RNA small subunit methyltransferase A [marine bacterium B5-7]|nr:MAG: ribosomal RNA small subunit methyltransferase A [marine bacterium B5-7]
MPTYANARRDAAPRAKKRLGQHFLNDEGVIRSIIQRFALRPDSRVVEIGPGTGAITASLLDAGVHLTAVEFDRDMHVVLKQRFAGNPRFELIEDDILNTSITALAADGRLRIIGNLPYNIASAIVFHLLDSLDVIDDMYLMLQKEVADRIASTPGGRTYGKPSVLIQRYCTAEVDFLIPPTAFTPPPRVMSAMLRLRPRDQPLGGVIDGQRLNRIVSAAFAKRRKTLRNALKELAGPSAFERAEIDPARRAETLSVEDFVRLTRAIELVDGPLTDS